MMFRTSKTFTASPAIAIAFAAILSGCGSPDERAQGYYEAGMALIAKKDDLEARKELLKAVKYKSDKVEVWRALAELPNNMAFRLSLAELQIFKGDNDGAIAQYEAILKDDPNQQVAINNLVSLLLDTRSDKQSLDRAIGLSAGLKTSTVPQFQDTLGWAQFKQGDYKGAITTLETASAKLPNLAALRYHLGMSYAAAGQPEKASEQLKLALSLEPDGTPLKESIRTALK